MDNIDQTNGILFQLCLLESGEASVCGGLVGSGTQLFMLK